MNLAVCAGCELRETRRRAPCRTLEVAQMLGRGVIMRAATAGTMTVDLNGGDLIAATRASLLTESNALAAMHYAQLAATAGTPAYVDGTTVSVVQLAPSGPTVVATTLAQAISSAITSIRAMGYLPIANITDSDPSTFFVSRNLVAICEAAEGSVYAAADTVSSSSNLYSSPVFIFVAIYVAFSLVGCVVVFSMSRRALDFRMVPLERMSQLPNSVLQRLENAAASSVAAAERAIEDSETAADGDADSHQSEEEDVVDWRAVNLTRTTKDLQKGTGEQPRERLIFSGVLMAPLLASSLIFILLLNAIWTGTQAASSGANALTASKLAQVSVRQAVYYGLVGATLSDADVNGTIIPDAFQAQADAASRIDGIFFGATGDEAADAALETIYFGDMCAAGVLPLPAYQRARCRIVGGGACNSGLHAIFGAIIRNAAAMLNARVRMAVPRTPSVAQVSRLRGLMDQQIITDMRILEFYEASGAMALDFGTREARVQATVNGSISTGDTLVVVVIVGAIVYQVCALRKCASCGACRTCSEFR